MLPFLIVAVFTAVHGPPKVSTLELPFGPVTRLPSPNGLYVLYGQSSQLWMENTRDHKRKMLLEVNRNVRAGWSPDSAAFFVEDNASSDSTRSFLYEVSSLQRLDIADHILTADPSAQRFAEGHAYFRVERWEGTQHVLINFNGHTDQFPVQCFTMRYRVSRSGTVRKLLQRIRPVTAHGCEP